MPIGLILGGRWIHAEMGTRKTAKSGHQHSEQFTLRQQLKAEPHHHWILTRLSSVYTNKDAMPSR